jgi:small subunit ribosomal protein S8
MAQDIVADALNQIMNIKRVGKTEVVIKRSSKVLLNLLELMKNEGHIDFEVNKEKKTVTVKILKLNECRAVKPRYFVGVADLPKYMKRFLPSRNLGLLIVSTSKGLMNQHDVQENKIGGCLIAYFY